MNVFVFDIETVPDTDLGRKLYDLDAALSDKDVASIMLQKRREETGESEFLRLHMHRVVAISAVFRSSDSVKVWSLGDPESDEKELLQRFFDVIDKVTPTLVSWNGSGFDLPVLHYRALKHGVVGSRYWDMGEDDRDFKWNNYLSRYHQRHTDLMDVIAAFQPRATAPLDQIALMLGYPGKMGMSGDRVCDQFMDGNIIDIRNYCETDVLNTYLVYLRWLQIKGELTTTAWEQETELLKSVLRSTEPAHLQEFLRIWEQA